MVLVALGAQRGSTVAAYAAVALAFSYLTRNEAIGGAAAGAVIVAAVSFGRADGRRLSRAKTAVADAAIFGVPSFIAAAGWAITSYVITGEPFEQFSSIYGTSTQQSLLRTKIMTLHGRALFEVHVIGALAPLIPLVLIASVAVAFWRRDPRVLAPLAVLGGALGFDMLAYLDNSIQQFLRYFIAVLPLEVLLVGGLVAAVQASRPVPDGLSVGTRSHHLGVRALAVLGFCLPCIRGHDSCHRDHRVGHVQSKARSLGGQSTRVYLPCASQPG